MLLARILKDAGHSVSIERALYSRVRQRLKQYSFDILAFSTPSLFYEEFIALNRHLKKEFEYYAVFGGSHPTFVPEIIAEDSIDCVCRGEGEYAFLELVEAYKRNAPLCGIDNIWTKADGHICRNAVRPLIKDLDSLPFPDRDLFPFSETFTKGKMHVLTGRGCPFNCSYCSQPGLCELYGEAARIIRRRSVTNVIEEIMSVIERAPVRFIMFEDDLFTIDEKWLHTFACIYKKEIGLPFFCYGRADVMNAELALLLKDAGCVTMSIGIETANDYLRNTVLKRNMTDESILDASNAVKKAGMRLEGLNIIGIPKGSLADDLKTIDLNRACSVDYASVKLLMPYPGTQIHASLGASGLLRSGFDRWRTSVAFNDPGERRAVENLCLLFGIAVEFPFLLPFIRVAIYWPLGFMYKIVFYAWDGYAAFFRLYPTGWRGFLWGLRKYIMISKMRSV